MKLLFYTMVLYFGRVAFSCHKNIDPAQSLSDSSLMIKLKTCSNKILGSQTVTLCLDSVLQDSRCPANVVCVWQGVAVAKFSFTTKGSTYPLILSTTNFAGNPADTVVSGFKIKFINLFPYPGTYTPPAPIDQIKAEVQITKQ